MTNTQTINSQQTLHGNQMEKKHPRFFQFPDAGNGKTIPEYLNIQYVLNTQVVIWSFTHISTKYFQSINGKHTSKRPLVCDNTKMNRVNDCHSDIYFVIWYCSFTNTCIH